MLKQFETWPDVIQHVRSGEALYYVPNESIGPCRMVARLRLSSEDNVRLWMRCPEYMANTFPSMIADKTFLDKLYRWEPRKAGP